MTREGNSIFKLQVNKVLCTLVREIINQSISTQWENDPNEHNDIDITIIASHRWTTEKRTNSTDGSVRLRWTIHVCRKWFSGKEFLLLKTSLSLKDYLSETFSHPHIIGNWPRPPYKNIYIHIHQNIEEEEEENQTSLSFAIKTKTEDTLRCFPRLSGECLM